MSVAIRFPLTIKLVFTIYTVTILLLLELMTAVMIVPLVILSAHALLARPKAICIIGEHKNMCLNALTFAAESLEIEEVHIFEATRKEEEIQPVGVYDSSEEMFYELVDEDDDSSAS